MDGADAFADHYVAANGNDWTDQGDHGSPSHQNEGARQEMPPAGVIPRFRLTQFLRSEELNAYRSVLRAFYGQQGEDLDPLRGVILSSLRELLSISPERHRTEKASALLDTTLEAVRRNRVHSKPQKPPPGNLKKRPEVAPDSHLEQPGTDMDDEDYSSRRRTAPRKGANPPKGTKRPRPEPTEEETRLENARKRIKVLEQETSELVKQTNDPSTSQERKTEMHITMSAKIGELKRLMDEVSKGSASSKG